MQKLKHGGNMKGKEYKKNFRTKFKKLTQNRRPRQSGKI